VDNTHDFFDEDHDLLLQDDYGTRKTVSLRGDQLLITVVRSS
jgi:hypothetical protein